MQRNFSIKNQHAHRSCGQNKYSAGNPVYMVILGRDKINDKSFKSIARTDGTVQSR